MDKVKEIVKKYGGYIQLGGFALIFISVFLPFISASVMGLSISASFTDDGAWGWIILFLALIGAAVVAIEAFKIDLFNKAKNNIVELLVNYLPLGLAGFIFLVTLIEGIEAKTSYTHWGVGFYFIMIAALAIICVNVVRRFLLKETFKFEK